MLDESKFLEMQNRHQESGLNVKDFCSNEGINPSTFYYWLKKFRQVTPAKRFIPLVVKSPQGVTTQRYTKGHPPVQDLGQMEDDALLELVYPNGTKLRIKKDLDLSHLRSLIHLYD